MIDASTQTDKISLVPETVRSAPKSVPKSKPKISTLSSCDDIENSNVLTEKEMKKYDVIPKQMMMVKININDNVTVALVDTGAQGCVMSERLMNEFKLTYTPYGGILLGAGASKVIGVCEDVPISFGLDEKYLCDFIITNLDNLRIILGLNFFRQYLISLDMTALYLENEIVPFMTQDDIIESYTIKKKITTETSLDRLVKQGYKPQEIMRALRVYKTEEAALIALKK